MDALDGLVRDALVTTALISLPMLLLAAVGRNRRCRSASRDPGARANADVASKNRRRRPDRRAVWKGGNACAGRTLRAGAGGDPAARRPMVIATLVFARCAGFIFRAPGFSHPSVPAALRAGLALVLTGAIVPGISQRAPLIDGAAFALGIAAEFLIGSVAGMTASLIYDAAYAGGRIVDDYVGVKAIAPSLQLVAPSGYGRVWSLAFTGAFFLSGAYRLALLGFAESFERLPLGAPPFEAPWHAYAPAFAATFVTVALGWPRRRSAWRSSCRWHWVRLRASCRVSAALRWRSPWRLPPRW